MTKLNKVLLGTGIILLIYSLENLSTATSFIWLIFAIIILAVSIGNKQQVNVVEVEGMKGYRFDAIDKESLKLASKLAVAQTQSRDKITVR